MRLDYTRMVHTEVGSPIEPEGNSLINLCTTTGAWRCDVLDVTRRVQLHATRGNWRWPSVKKVMSLRSALLQGQ